MMVLADNASVDCIASSRMGKGKAPVAKRTPNRSSRHFWPWPRSEQFRYAPQQGALRSI